ncbi:MAG: phosphatidylserine synthase [Acidobacteria bacterium]|nr:phosphatidylserine synthase [Acidobacteriota bacterium]
MRATLLAWAAHLYTAVGLLCAAGIAVLVVRGDPAAFRGAFLLMALATLVDATDGWLARRARVEEVLPGFDGRRLDDLIDFHTYTTLPLLVIWRAGLLGGAGAWLLVPLVASAYGFSQADAKTEDHSFLGFPSYWNVVAAYLYLLRLPAPWALALVLVLAALTFVPVRYLYTTRRGPLSAATNVLGAIWAAAFLAILWRWDAAPRWWVAASLLFPAYYMAASWALSIRRWRRARRATEGATRPRGDRAPRR